MRPKILKGTDITYAKLALRIFIGPRDMEWHNVANQLLDEAPDYAYDHDKKGDIIPPRDIDELAGRMLGYYAGLIEWTPEP